MADLKYRFHVKGTNDTRIEVFPSGMSIDQVRDALDARYGGPGMVRSVFYAGTASSGAGASSTTSSAVDSDSSVGDSGPNDAALASGGTRLLTWALMALPQLCVAGAAVLYAARWGTHHHIQPASGWITALLLLVVAAAAYAVALLPIWMLPRRIYAPVFAAIAAIVAGVYLMTPAYWGQYVHWIAGQIGDYAGYAGSLGVGGVLLALLLTMGLFWVNHKMHSDAFGWHRLPDEE